MCDDKSDGVRAGRLRGWQDAAGRRCSGIAVRTGQRRSGGLAPGGVAPGGPRAPFDIRVEGPAVAKVGAPTIYTLRLFNKSDRPIYQAGAELFWDQDLVESGPQNAELFRVPVKPNAPPSIVWPKGFFEVLQPNESRTLKLELLAKTEGRFCLKASASANSAPDAIGDLKANDQACTVFSRTIAGMTLEMFDRDDPILKDGQTSYPITVRNQGNDPITNLQVKALVPDLLDIVEVRGPGNYRKVPAGNRGEWVEFEPLAVLNARETRNYEIAVARQGQRGRRSLSRRNDSRSTR